MILCCILSHTCNKSSHVLKSLRNAGAQLSDKDLISTLILRASPLSIISPGIFLSNLVRHPLSTRVLTVRNKWQYRISRYILAGADNKQYFTGYIADDCTF